MYPRYFRTLSMAIKIFSDEEYLKITDNLLNYTAIEHGQNKGIVESWLKDDLNCQTEISENEFTNFYIEVLVKLNRKLYEERSWFQSYLDKQTN